MTAVPGDFALLREAVRAHGGFNCRVVSDSMTPFLKVGEIVRIEPVGDFRDLRRFDVIVYKSGDKLFCHYVWSLNRLEPPTVVTRSLKGRRHDDLPVPFGDILGRATGRRLPLGSRLWLFARDLLSGDAG
jgi:signal peptidase I